MKKYKIKPEVVLAGFRDGLHVPEIKIRFNKGKKFLGTATNSDDVYKFVTKLYGRDIETQERVIILYLNKRNEIIGFYKHSIGGIDSSIMDLRLIISTALKALATSIIITHNHPSSNKTPSETDRNITRKIIASAKTNDIVVLDHIIVTKNSGYYSFTDEGVLNGIYGLSNITPMNISINNYFNEISNMKIVDLPSSFKETHELLMELTEKGKNLTPYNKLDKELKDVFELYFSKLTLWIEKNSNPKEKPKANIKEKANKSLTIADIPASVKAFMPLMQQKTIVGSEEHEKVIANLKSIIENMPKTYDTENIEYPNKIAYLHYFHGGSDWYIIEKDKNSSQKQAYGFAILNDDTDNAEFGYIDIEEIKSMGKVELDFFFKPKAMREIFAKDATLAIRFLRNKATVKPDNRKSKKKDSTAKKVKPKYKVGFKFFWRDNDGVSVSETIESSFVKSDGTVTYKTKTSPVREGQNTWEYNEADIIKGLKDGVLGLKPLPKMVENLEPEIRYIKRYIGLNGKTKSKDEIYSFLLALQKSILKKEIRKTSPYASVINHIQEQLIAAHKMIGDKKITIKIEPKTLEKYAEIANGKRVMLSVTYIKQYLNLLKTPTKEKAKTLLEHINKALHFNKIPENCIYMEELKYVKSSLSEYISKGEFNSITEQELRGLMGICRCNGESVGLGILPTLVATAAGIVIGKRIDKVQDKIQEKKDSPLYNNGVVEVINSSDIVSKKFDTLKFTGKWKTLIGEPSPNFSMMIYGPPKCKKSTLAIEFAKYLAANHGKVLYAAFEEGIGETLRDKIVRLNAIHKNLIFSNGLPDNLSEYRFIFVDSVNRAKLSYENLLELKRKCPDAAFVYILQVTKDGNYRGSQEIEHEVDVIIHCDENQVAHSNGRFSQGGEMEI